MTKKEKTKALLHMSDKDMVDRILAFPDREHLNRDEDGKRRRYPSAEMAVRARRSMEKDPDYRISDKQKWAMASSFAEYSTNELKVAGIKFAKADPAEMVKVPVVKEGTKTVYNMQFHLVPEPENQHDKNAVAVYVDREDDMATGNPQDPVRIGYLPAAYTGIHPIASPMEVHGTLTDHSNGHFKTISYALDMDTEAIDKEFMQNNRTDAYTYRMPFILNGNAKDGIAEYVNNKTWTAPGGIKNGWTEKLNEELEYWGINGRAENVRFEFPGGKAGSIVVETQTKLNVNAMGACGSYFRHCLETGISTDLSREGYVDCASHIPAVNTRERTYFSLQSEPEEDDFTKAVEGIPEEDFMRAIDSLSGDGIAFPSR